MKLFFLGMCLLMGVMSGMAYDNMVLPQGNTTVLATALTKQYMHVFALGQDGNLYHKYMDTSLSTEKWTDWILRAVAVNGTWNSDPCVGVNADGSIEVFIRYSTNLDLWQIYQADPADPNNWSVPREAACPTPPNCQQPLTTWYWNIQPSFPTSNCQIVPDLTDGRLQVFIRGFDGGYYVFRQTAVNSHQYVPPHRFDTIME